MNKEVHAKTFIYAYSWQVEEGWPSLAVQVVIRRHTHQTMATKTDGDF